MEENNDFLKETFAASTDTFEASKNLCVENLWNAKSTKNSHSKNSHCT